MLLGKINALTFRESSKRYFNLKYFQKRIPEISSKPLSPAGWKTVPSVNFTFSIKEEHKGSNLIGKKRE